MAATSSDIDSLQGVCISFIVIVTLAVALRFYTRCVYAHLAIDDWAILASWTTFVGNCALGLVMVTQLEQPHLSANFGMILRAKATTWIATMLFLKLSLCFFFLKIFLANVFRVQRYLIIVTTVLYQVFSLVYLIYTCTSCGITGPLDPNAPICTEEESYHIMSFTWSICNIITDFVLCGLAAYAVHHANINLYAQISAYIILAFGTLGGIASILRLIFVSGALTLSRAVLWAIIEAGCGILAASLATLRPLLRAFMHKIRATTTVRSIPNGSTEPTPTRKDSTMEGKSIQVLQHAYIDADIENGMKFEHPGRRLSFITSALPKIHEARFV